MDVGSPKRNYKYVIVFVGSVCSKAFDNALVAQLNAVG